MQSLYEWDFKGRKEELLAEILEHTIKEFGGGLGIVPRFKPNVKARMAVQDRRDEVGFTFR